MTDTVKCGRTDAGQFLGEVLDVVEVLVSLKGGFCLGLGGGA